MGWLGGIYGLLEEERRHSHSALPTRNNTAAVDLMYGQIFMGTMDVFALVNPVSTAIAISMPADARYTIMETGLGSPPRVVIDRVSAPMKHIARPSATHSILIMRLLSSDIAPKP